MVLYRQNKNRAVFFVCLILGLVGQLAAAEFSLKILGGWGWSEGGDLNRSISGWREYFRDKESAIFSSTYGVDEIHALGELGGGLTIKISPRWRLGVEISFLRQRGRGEISTRLSSIEPYSLSPLQSGVVSLNETSTQSPFWRVEAIPVVLSLSYLFPLGEKVNLWVGGGGGLYFGRYVYQEEYALESDYLDEVTGPGSFVQYVIQYSTSGNYTEKLKTVALGLQGAAGLEIKLTTSLSLSLEILGRWVDLGSWEGTKRDFYQWSQTWGYGGISSDQGSNEDTSDGELWRVDDLSEETGKAYPRLLFSKGEPVSSSYSEARSASIRLSGMSVRIGLGIRFGRAR